MLNDILFTEPLFAKALKQMDVGLYIFDKVVLYILHINLKETATLIFIESLLNLFHAVVGIEIIHFWEIAFFIYRYLMTFVNPCQKMLGRLDHVAKRRLEGCHGTLKTRHQQVAHEARHVGLTSNEESKLDTRLLFQFLGKLLPHVLFDIEHG